MDLTRYIKELLYQHQCVTLPGFGAFLTHNKSIEVNRYTGEFTPPSRSLSFNQLIDQNDGLLANYLAKKQKRSYDDALVSIEREMIRWRKQLQTQAVVLPGIGEFSTNAENKLRFIPYGKLNFDANAIGLKSFYRSPIKEQLQVASIVPPQPSKKPSAMENNKEPLAFTPEKQESGSGMRYAVIGIIAVSILGAFYYFGNQYLESERQKSSELAQKRIVKNVQEARFDLGAIAGLQLNVPASVQTTGISEGPSMVSGSFYSVIAGSFSEQANAERKLAKLKAEGFEAAYAEQSPDGHYRVAFGRFKSKREAYNLLSFITTTLQQEAWYLVEGN